MGDFNMINHVFEALNDTSISLDDTHRPKQDRNNFKYYKLLYNCDLCQSVIVKCQLRHGHNANQLRMNIV